MKKFGRSMMTGKVLINLIIFLSFQISQALYEDQIGKFDW